MTDQQYNATDLRVLPSMAAEALYELLDDPDAKVRHEAVKTLGKIGDAQSYRKLIAALKDHDKNVRKTAAWALGQIGERGSMVSALRPEQYLQQRVMKKIKIYGDLSEGQERYYNITSMSAIILSVLVPILVNVNQLPAFRVLATIFSAMVTILVAAEKLYLFREHWRNYDFAEEKLTGRDTCFRPVQKITQVGSTKIVSLSNLMTMRRIGFLPRGVKRSSKVSERRLSKLEKRRARKLRARLGPTGPFTSPSKLPRITFSISFI